MVDQRWFLPCGNQSIYLKLQIIDWFLFEDNICLWYGFSYFDVAGSFVMNLFHSEDTRTTSLILFFIVNFDYILQIVLVFPLLTWKSKCRLRTENIKQSLLACELVACFSNLLLHIDWKRVNMGNIHNPT